MAIYKHYPNQDKRYVVVYPHQTVTLYEGSNEYKKMVDEVEAGTSTIEEVDDTPVTTYVDGRIAAYASIGDQLDMQYHDVVDSTTTWKDHVKAVKDAHPKD